MAEDRLVSVVIPVHNGERFISRTLASALAQTYAHLEFIIVDDGSTDQTASLAATAAARDSRIRLFRTPNSGVAAARNFGISQARGTLIALLDADDLWHPEKIAHQVEVMQMSSPNVGLVYCWSVEIDENDFVVPSVKRLTGKAAFQGHVTAELATQCFIDTSSSILIKRSCVDAVGGYDIDLKPQGAEDWKLYLALSETYEFAVVPEYLVGYRRASGSLTRGSLHAQSTQLVIRWLTEKWPDLPEELGRLRTYNVNTYYAFVALENNQFLKGSSYMVRACKARPKGLLDQTIFSFVARLLFRMTGLRRAALRRRGWIFRRPVRYQEFQAIKGSALT
jgi:glycosyltransferase involved in cell wall biosynthesis